MRLHQKYLGESVTGTEKGLGKEIMRFRLSIIFWDFWCGCQQMCR